MVSKDRQYKLTSAIVRAEQDIRSILDNHESDRYYEAIILLNSLIENVLRWLVYVKDIWDKVNNTTPEEELNMPQEIREKELESLRKCYNDKNLKSLQETALKMNLIDGKLFKKLTKMREERNDLVHQCYLFTHRKNPRVLRAKLNKMVSTADKVFEVFNALIKEIGFDDNMDVFLVGRKNKQKLI